MRAAATRHLLSRNCDACSTHLLVDFVAKHAELKALELHHQDGWRLVNGHALGCPYFLLLLWADVLVCAVQVLTGGEALQGLLHRAGFVDLQAEVQEDVIRIGLMTTLCAFHLQVTMPWSQVFWTCDLTVWSSPAKHTASLCSCHLHVIHSAG